VSIEDFPVVAIFATTTLAGEIAFAFDRERETVWATQAQIVELFGLDVSGVSRHIRNIFRDSEIDQESNLQKMQIANSDRPVTLYSLDATPGAAPSWTLTTDEARRVIAQVGAAFPNDTLFGNERGDAHDCHERPERKGPHGRACGSDAGRGGVVILRDMGLRNTNLRHTTALT